MNKMRYEKTGVLTIKNLRLPPPHALRRGVAISECIEYIPCNPCVDACPFHAITMNDMNAPPEIDYEKCTGCTKCIAICPGLALFVVQINSTAKITLPYEFLPIPKVGDMVTALDRQGKRRDKAKVLKVQKRDKCSLITIEAKKGLGMEIRNILIE